MALSKAELKLISELLEETSEEYSNHGVNDWDLENTPENKEMLIKAINWNGDEYQIEEDIPEILMSNKKQLITNDSFMMNYLAHRCEEESQ